MFEFRISAGAKEKLPTRASGKSDAETISSGSYDMEGHAKKCVERYCELANKTTQQFFKVATQCMDDHQLKEEENESVGELSKVCSQIVLKCLYLARIGRLDILWSVNNLARATTKWTKSCNTRLVRLILFHSSYKWIPSILLCGKHCTTMQTRIVSRLWLCRRLWTLEINIRRNSVHFREPHVCAKRLDVQETNCCFTQFYRSWNHLSMQVYAALTLWELVIEVFYSVPNRTDGPKREPWGNPSAVVKPNMHNPIPIKHTNVIPTNIDHIPSNTTDSDHRAMLYPTTNWKDQFGPQKQIRNIDTKHQLADMLCEGNFTRDECKKLLHLFNITYFSSTCCNKNFKLISNSTMAKRIQDQKGEERVLSQSRPASTNLSSFYCVKFLHRIESDCI